MKCICGGNILIRSKGHSVTGIACTGCKINKAIELVDPAAVMQICVEFKERMGKCKEAMR